MNFNNTTDTHYDGDNNDIIEFLILLLIIAITIICCVKNGGCENEPYNASDRAHQAQLRRAEGPLFDV